MKNLNVCQIKSLISYFNSYYYDVNSILRNGLSKFIETNKEQIQNLQNNINKNIEKFKRSTNDDLSTFYKQLIKNEQSKISKIETRLKKLTLFIKKLNKIITDLDLIFTSSKITTISNGLMVYRGVSLDSSPYSSKPILEKGFLSTTTDEDTALFFNWSQCCIYVLYIEPGIPYIDVKSKNIHSMSESEILLPRNLYITKINKKDKLVYSSIKSDLIKIEYLYVSKSKPKISDLPSEDIFKLPVIDMNIKYNITDYLKILFFINNDLNIKSATQLYNFFQKTKNHKLTKTLSEKLFNYYRMLKENGVEYVN